MASMASSIALPSPPLSSEQVPVSVSSPIVKDPSNSHAGGAGGKLRDRRVSLQRKRTPYDRPSSGRHAVPGGAALFRLSSASDSSRFSIASRLVGSASRLLSSSVLHLYSSIFNRRDRFNSDSGEDGQPEDELEAGSPLVQVEAVDSHNDVSSGGDIAEKEEDEAELLEVEEILKRKMLSRQQFNRLTEILRSRILDNNADGQLLMRDNENKEERDLPKNDQELSFPQSEAQRWREDCKKAQEEKRNPLWGVGVSRSASEALLKISGAGCASPVEVARAFMGERTARASGSVLPIRGRAHPEQLPVRTPELWQHGGWVPEERFWTPSVKTLGCGPGSLRTPYRRSYISPSVEIQTTDTLPARWTPIPIPVTHGREGLKRRSSVLDDGYSIGGPIRRTRSKTLALTDSNNLPIVRGAVSAGKGLSDLPVASVGLKLQTAANPGVEGNNGALSSWSSDDKEVAASSLMSVPVQSSETARKILETLDKMTPSPKGKSLEEELILVRERPPAELTTSMLNEHARKSMQVVDSPPLQESREAGPSSKFENDSPVTGIAMSGVRTNGQTSRDKEKMGTAPGPLSELHDKASFIGSESFPIQVFKSDKLFRDERSASKPQVSNISASEVVKREGFRMNAVFEETNSDDEVRPNIKGTESSEAESLKLKTPVSTESLITVSTAPDRLVGGNEPGFLAVSKDSFVASSVDSPMTSMGPTFTFPFASNSGVTSGPPSPKPLPFPSSFGGTILSSFPVIQFGTPLGSKGSIFSFAGSTSSEQATMKLDAGESKKDLALSGAATTVSSSLQSSAHGQEFPDSKTSVYASNAMPVQLSPSVSKMPMLSSSLSTGVLSQVSKASLLGVSPDTDTSAVLSGPLNFSSPTLVSQMMPYSSMASSSFVGSSITTDSGSSNAVSSSSLLSSSLSLSSSSPSSFFFGQQKIPSQFGSMGSTGQESLLSSGSIGEVQRPQKRSLSFVEQDSSKRSCQITAVANGSAAAASLCFGGGGSMSAGISSSSFSFSNQLCSGSVQSNVPVVNQSSQALTSSVSVISSPVFVTTASPASSFLVSSSFPGTPISYGRTSGSSSDSSVSSTHGHSGSAFTFSEARKVEFGGESSSLQATNSSLFGAATPAFGTNSPFGTTSSFGFGSSTVPAFGLSNSLFASATAKPFGTFVGDSIGHTTSASAPIFSSGFGIGSIGFASSFSSSSMNAFGAGSASSPAENNLSFGSLSGMSSSPFSFGTKESPALPHTSLFGSSSFGSSASVVASGDTSTNDQMEDSMAEEPPQSIGNVTPQTPIFGATSPGLSPVPAMATANFVFGAQPNASIAGQSIFTFGAQPVPNTFTAQGAPIQKPFVQPANLDYGGGGFSLGASGGEKSGRKFVKGKRTGGAKRGR